MAAPTARLALFCALAPAAAALAGCRTPIEARRGGARGAPPISEAVASSETVLDNGVRVVVEENHVAPVVAIVVWVDLGAADEPPALSGVAHLFEHLVLRGSKRHPSGAAARAIETAGGSLGAWTGLDETVYHAVVAPPFLAVALDALADAVASPTLDAADIERARAAVLDEIRSAGADPVRRASEALYATAFAGHGYAHPVLGTSTSVAALTPAAIAARAAAAHVGSAVTVVVVGDVGPDAAPAIARAFAGVPRGKAARDRGALPRSPARVAVTGVAGPEAAVALGFRTGPLAPEDAAVVDLLAAMLGRAGASRLDGRLVRNRRLATAVRPSTFNSRDGGLISFALVATPRRIADVAEAATDVVLGLAREVFDPDEVEAARTAVAGDLARGEAGPLGRARRLGFATVMGGGAETTRRYREHLASLGSGELAAAAAKLLRADALTIAAALPEARSPGREDSAATLKTRLEATLAGAEARAARAASPAAVPAAEVKPGEPVRFVAASGTRVLVLRDPGAPLVSVTAAFSAAGGGGESAADGPAALIAALLDRGTRTRSASDIRARLRGMAGRLSGFAGTDAFGLRAEFLPRDVDQGLAVVADCLLRPNFPEEDLEIEKRALVGRLQSASRGGDGDARQAWRLFRQALLSDRARPSDPDPLSALTRVRLLDHYRRHHPPSRLAIAVVGDVDPARVVAALAPELASRPDSSQPAAPVGPASPVPPSRAEPAVVSRTTTSGGGEAVVGYPTFAPGDPDRVVMEVVAEMLAGDGGRVSLALRQDDARTLGCRASGRAASGLEPGYLAVALSCPPGRIDPAVAIARAELTRLAAAGAGADEVARAARRIGGGRSVALGTRAAVADALALDEARGLAPLTHRRHATALLRVGVADVTRAVQRALDPKREVVSVVSGAGS